LSSDSIQTPLFGANYNYKDRMIKTFGGNVVVLGGYFGQILPIVRKWSRLDVVATTLNSSKIWSTWKVSRLWRKMRLTTIKTNNNDVEIEKI